MLICLRQIWVLLQRRVYVGKVAGIFNYWLDNKVTSSKTFCSYCHMLLLVGYLAVGICSCGQQGKMDIILVMATTIDNQYLMKHGSS